MRKWQIYLKDGVRLIALKNNLLWRSLVLLVKQLISGSVCYRIRRIYLSPGDDDIKRCVAAPLWKLVVCMGGPDMLQQLPYCTTIHKGCRSPTCMQQSHAVLGWVWFTMAYCYLDVRTTLQVQTAQIQTLVCVSRQIGNTFWLPDALSWWCRPRIKQTCTHVTTMTHWLISGSGPLSQQVNRKNIEPQLIITQLTSVDTHHGC